MLSKVILLLALAGVGSAQVTTKVTIESIAAPVTGLFASVLINDVQTVVAVRLGQGLSFDLTDINNVTLKYTPPTAALEKFDVLAVRQPSGAWLLPDVPTGALQVRLNGLHMTQGTDYTVSGPLITFAVSQGAANGLDPAPVVSVNYRY